MKLAMYLEETGIPVTVFARKLGVSSGTIHNILSEENDLRLSIAVKIEDFTKGKITCRDLLPDNFLKLQKSKRTDQEKKSKKERN